MTNEIMQQVNQILKKHNMEIVGDFKDMFVEAPNGFPETALIKTYVLIDTNKSYTVYCKAGIVMLIVASDFEKQTIACIKK